MPKMNGPDGLSPSIHLMIREVTLNIDVFCAIIVAVEITRLEAVHAQDPARVS